MVLGALSVESAVHLDGQARQHSDVKPNQPACGDTSAMGRAQVDKMIHACLTVFGQYGGQP
jgi:hypothetical protein